jgi:hypothetical protein
MVCGAAPARLLLGFAAAAALSVACGHPSAGAEVLGARIGALEAEHQSLLVPADTEPASQHHWTPPVLDSDAHLFSWRVAAQRGAGAARNATQLSAVLTLTTPGRPPIVCAPGEASGLSVLCGSAAAWAPRSARYLATLTVAIRAGSATARATTQGEFIRGLQRGSPDGWGGAEWIGLVDPNSTAAQFRAVSDIRALGFTQSSDVAQATLFVAGLGGHRASVNSRPLDPTSVRGSVTEWSNRTFHFTDDVTADVAAAAGADGLVAVAVELCESLPRIVLRPSLPPSCPDSLPIPAAVAPCFYSCE